jgi:hypothetical protein
LKTYYQTKVKQPPLGRVNTMHLQVALHRRSAWLSGGPILSKRGYEMQLTIQVPNDINRMKQIVKLL